jgi:malate dehydrogenase (oxaloacetate-decarboxylating)
MLLAAADAISARVSQDELNPGFIIPSVFDPHVAADVAEAVATAAAKNK